jgi:hypothetical protein
MDPRQYGFIPGQFPGYGNSPGASTMGNFPTPPTFPSVYQNPPNPPPIPNGLNNPPLFPQNYQIDPTTVHRYPPGYTMDMRQPFTMPGQFPQSPNFNDVPIIQQRLPVQGMNPYQRVAMAEQFAKSVRDATTPAHSNVAGPSSTPENLNPNIPPPAHCNPSTGPVTAPTLSPQDITANQPPSSSQKVSVNIPKNHSHPPSCPRGVRKFAGQNSSMWLEHVQSIIQYQFHDPDILEEALESPSSGITCVGNTHRDLGNGGNKRLAAVGTRAMELLLMSECYCACTKESRSMMASSCLTIEKANVLLA